jgi:hypothetical protein
VDASPAEGFVTRADLELKERVDCAAALRVDAAVLPLLRRDGGMVGCSGGIAKTSCRIGYALPVIVADNGA